MGREEKIEVSLDKNPFAYLEKDDTFGGGTY